MDLNFQNSSDWNSNFKFNSQVQVRILKIGPNPIRRHTYMSGPKEAARHGTAREAESGLLGCEPPRRRRPCRHQPCRQLGCETRPLRLFGRHRPSEFPAPFPPPLPPSPTPNSSGACWPSPLFSWMRAPAPSSSMPPPPTPSGFPAAAAAEFFRVFLAVAVVLDS